MEEKKKIVPMKIVYRITGLNGVASEENVDEILDEDL
jgi:hypothetical protein